MDELQNNDLYTLIAVAVGVVLVFGVVIIFSISHQKKKKNRSAED